MRSSPRLLATLALALAAACSKRDVETRPFRLVATLPDGQSLSTLSASPTVIQLLGVGKVDAPDRLVLQGARLQRAEGEQALGDVTFSFDRTVAPLIAIPERLDEQPLVVEVGLRPEGFGPKLEPLDITGFRIATGLLAPTYEFMIGEGTVEAPGGEAELPAPLYFLSGSEDIPSLAVRQDLLDYEPAECGLVYLDVLAVGDQGGSPDIAALRRGAVHLVAVGQRADPWIVLHVLSWHRQGTCSGQASVWTQIAAWR
ncbi:MAG: hypothetical protein QM767_21920 [Anaeromyxobacter sp.]